MPREMRARRRGSVSALCGRTWLWTALLLWLAACVDGTWRTGLYKTYSVGTQLSRDQTAASHTSVYQKRNWCPHTVTKTVTCQVQNGTVLQRVYQTCRWPQGCTGGSYRTVVRPSYKVVYRTVTSLEWKCCPGFSGAACEEGRVILYSLKKRDCLNCSRITALSDRLNSLEAKVLRVKRGEMGFLAERGSQGLGGCQVPVGLAERAGQGAHLEPLDQRDPQDQQVPVVHRDSQERGVYQARLGLQGLQHLPVPTSQTQTTLEEKTLSSPTLSMTHEVYQFQDLRAPLGLSGPLGYPGERGFRGESDVSLQMFHDLQADLELLARRVTLLEAIIWPEPDLGSGDGPFGTASPSFYRDKRAGALPYRLASPLSSDTKVRGK
ncbi:hypothetical protein F2P81_013928 [Scophthalmus maximus]|uniref:EMI domain-containing protein n=1 Tax=Scophthalmus maximus TaxID=52904 RepID=A0A6A4SUV0_SCOMX|nr:hypothetical protein F2P81_013928 [Scophthalmus maximus]